MKRYRHHRSFERLWRPRGARLSLSQVTPFTPACVRPLAATLHSRGCETVRLRKRRRPSHDRAGCGLSGISRPGHQDYRRERRPSRCRHPQRGHMVFGAAEAFTPEQLLQVYDTNVLSTQRVNRPRCRNCANRKGWCYGLGHQHSRWHSALSFTLLLRRRRLWMRSLSAMPQS